MTLKEKLEKKAEEDFYASFELEKEAFWGAAARAASSFFTRGVAKKGVTSAVKTTARKGPGKGSKFILGSKLAPIVQPVINTTAKGAFKAGKVIAPRAGKAAKYVAGSAFSKNKLRSGAFWVGGVGAGGGALTSKAWHQSRQN